MKLTRAEYKRLLAIDAGPYHCQRVLGREKALVARLQRRGLVTESKRFGGVTLTTSAHYAIGTFKVWESLKK